MKKPGLHYLNQVVAAIKKLIKGGGSVTESDLDAIVKQARGHAGGKAKSENMKAATAALVAFEQKRVADEGDEGANQSGLMVAFYLSTDAAAQLAIPLGEAPEALHLTLCYLGDASQFNELAIADILIACRNHANWQVPLSGEVSGTGRFIGDGDQDVYYASVDVGGLSEFRTDLARRLASCGTPANTEHDFDPHITLAYLAKDDPTPDYDMSDIALRFDVLTVQIGNRRIDMPLMRSMNYSEVADLCADSDAAQQIAGGPMRLFIEQPATFSEPPANINYLPKPGKYTNPRFGEIVITRERNQRFVDNFLAGVYQAKLPIDNEHDLEKSGASGWITMLAMNDDGSVQADVEWTDRGTFLIENDRFKYFSPAWFNVWSKPEEPDKPIKDVAIGGALTIRPFFKENSLQPLVAHEGELAQIGVMQFSEGAGHAGDVSFSDLTRIPDAGEPASSSSEGAPDMTTAATGTPANVTELQTKLAAAEALAASEKTRADTAEGKLAETSTAASEAVTAKEEVKKLNEKVSSLEKKDRTQRFTEMTRKWAGSRDGHLKMLEFMATATEKGEESEEFKAYVEQQNAVGTQLRNAANFSEIGTTAPAASSAIGKIEAKAREMSEKSQATNTPITIEQAMAKVIAAEPQLYKEYMAEQRGESSSVAIEPVPVPAPAGAGDGAAAAS